MIRSFKSGLNRLQAEMLEAGDDLVPTHPMAVWARTATKATPRQHFGFILLSIKPMVKVLIFRLDHIAELMT